MRKMHLSTGLLILFAGLIILTLGCAQTRFIVTGSTYEPWPGPVKILQELPKDQRYVEIGWVSGKMSGMVSDWGAILKAMQEEARLKGANAIILIDKDATSQATIGGSKHGFYGGTYEEKNLMAIAIRILD